MNILKNQMVFFPVPAEFVDGGYLRTLSPSAIKLYLTLMRLAQKYSAVQIEMPDYRLHDFTGLDHKSAQRARDELDRASLVMTRRVRGMTAYKLLNPLKSLPLPPPEGRKGIWRYFPEDGRSARTSRVARQANRATEEAGYPPEWDEIGEEQKC